jgi:hypothetical protein
MVKETGSSSLLRTEGEADAASDMGPQDSHPLAPCPAQVNVKLDMRANSNDETTENDPTISSWSVEAKDDRTTERRAARDLEGIKIRGTKTTTTTSNLTSPSWIGVGRRSSSKPSSSRMTGRLSMLAPAKRNSETARDRPEQARDVNDPTEDITHAAGPNPTAGACPRARAGKLMNRVPSTSSEIQPGAIRVRGINRSEADESSSKFDDDPVLLVRGGNDHGDAGERALEPLSSSLQSLDAIESGAFSLSSNSTTGEGDALMTTVTATAVTRDELEQELRDRILREAVVAHVSLKEDHEAASDAPGKAKAAACRSRLLASLSVLGVAAILAGTLSTVLKGSGSSSPSTANSTSTTTNSSSRLWTPELLKEFIIAELGSNRGFNMTGFSSSKTSYELILSGGAFDNTSLGPQIMDAFVLMSLWSGTGGGDVWKRSDGWNSNPNPCRWFGIGCDEAGRVSKISLPGNDLNGPLNSDLGYFGDRLTYLDVSDNHVGLFQFNLSVLPRLEHLNFSKNTNSGYTIGDVTNNYNLSYLEVLDVSSNVLIGPLSSEIAQLGRLRELHLQDNALKGAIPSEMSLLTNLSTLHLEGNQLTGDLPTAICSRTTAETGQSVAISVDCESVNCSCCICASG